jgi:hypothetical protein
MLQLIEYALILLMAGGGTLLLIGYVARPKVGDRP